MGLVCGLRLHRCRIVGMQFTRHTAGQGANLSVIVILLGMNLAITIDDLLSLLVLIL